MSDSVFAMSEGTYTFVISTEDVLRYVREEAGHRPLHEHLIQLSGLPPHKFGEVTKFDDIFFKLDDALERHWAEMLQLRRSHEAIELTITGMGESQIQSVN